MSVKFQGNSKISTVSVKVILLTLSAKISRKPSKIFAWEMRGHCVGTLCGFCMEPGTVNVSLRNSSSVEGFNHHCKISYFMTVVPVLLA